jgi:hypothetical protein
MLRRNQQPTTEEMRELLPVAAAKVSCPACGGRGIHVGQAEGDDDADWPAGRRCQSCGQVIPAERLEVFPEAELCVNCQGRVEDRLPQRTDEFCERCGWPLVVRPSRGRGISRQVLACSNPDCRRSPGKE